MGAAFWTLWPPVCSSSRTFQAVSLHGVSAYGYSRLKTASQAPPGPCSPPSGLCRNFTFSVSFPWQCRMKEQSSSPQSFLFLLISYFSTASIATRHSVHSWFYCFFPIYSNIDGSHTKERTLLMDLSLHLQRWLVQRRCAVNVCGRKEGKKAASKGGRKDREKGGSIGRRKKGRERKQKGRGWR